MKSWLKTQILTAVILAAIILVRRCITVWEAAGGKWERRI